MMKLVFNQVSNRWLVNVNDPLNEVLWETNDLNLSEEDYANKPELLCLISGIQIVNAFWKTSQMDGVPSSQDLSSVTTKDMADTISAVGDDLTIQSEANMEDDYTETFTHQSLGGSTLTVDQSLSSESLEALHENSGGQGEEEDEGVSTQQEAVLVLLNFTKLVTPPKDSKPRADRK